nr:YwmB family TATA-box binding protein [Clostridium sp. DMHC 10]
MGLTTNYKTNNNGEKECKNWIKNMNLNNKKVTIYNGKSYCINFDNKDVSGYIESVKKADYYDISIYIKLLTNKNNIDELKRKVTKSIGGKSTPYMYIKAKSKLKNISKVACSIKGYFDKNGVKNLKTTRMNNILSTTMYTGRYDYIFDNNKKVDLNYAVCKYNDGIYIMIGTPILNINY